MAATKRQKKHETANQDLASLRHHGASKPAKEAPWEHIHNHSSMPHRPRPPDISAAQIPTPLTPSAEEGGGGRCRLRDDCSFIPSESADGVSHGGDDGRGNVRRRGHGVAVCDAAVVGAGGGIDSRGSLPKNKREGGGGDVT